MNDIKGLEILNDVGDEYVASCAEIAKKRRSPLRYVLPIAAGLALAVAVFFAVKGLAGSHSDGEKQVAQPSGGSGGNSDVSACYRYSVRSFSDLCSHTAYIVRATVTAVDHKVGQQATLKVSKVYLGSVHETIYMNTVPDDKNISTGYEYLLFLGERPAELGDSDVYSPVGAGIGVIRLDESTKSIYLYRKFIDCIEFRAWLMLNGYKGWTVKSGI